MNEGNRVLLRVILHSMHAIEVHAEIHAVCIAIHQNKRRDVVHCMNTMGVDFNARTKS